mmetsp:Transcript_8812/g.13154  ORF Transcript_8812/g.13154 Transcript_8812/m.13154 type:complete len:284 (-) Transcript_8812:83-934(-)
MSAVTRRHRFTTSGTFSSKSNGLHTSKFLEVTPRNILLLCGVIFTLYVLKTIAGSILGPLRGFLENVEIQEDSLKHMFYFFIASQIIFIPTPLPFIITFYTLAIGYFFKWRGFILLFVSFITGIPLSFQAGRILRKSGLNVQKTLKSGYLGKGVEYFDSVRRIIVDRPKRMCFLLMWAPLPTQLLPFLVGLLTEVSTKDFIIGAVPSKLIHFCCPLIIGLEAKSFSMAVSGHSTSWLSVFVFILPIALSIILLAAMAYYIKNALEKMRKGVMDDGTYADKLIV